jgi:molybdenum cofactor cytidylyltransferase
MRASVSYANQKDSGRTESITREDVVTTATFFCVAAHSEYDSLILKENESVMLAVVILSAGESRRMGQPKALVPFPDILNQKQAGLTPAPVAQKTFLEHLIEVTRHPRTGPLRVVVGPHAAEIRARVKLEDGALVFNPDWQRGQLSSLQAAIRSLPEGTTEGMLVCLVDHPLISAGLVASLIKAFDRDKNRIVIPTFRGQRGHPVIFPSRMYAELLAAPEDVGARAVVQAHAGDVIEVPVEEEGILLNLNDPESLKRASNPK